MQLPLLHVVATIVALLTAMAADGDALAQTQPQQPPAAAPQPAPELKPAFDALAAKDYAKAERILKPLADRKDPRAQFLLGVEVYGFDKSPLYSLQKAIPLLKDTAERGFPPAMAYFGAALAEGAGVAKDKVEAYKYLALASRHKVPNTEPLLARLASEMSPEEIERAKKAADAFVPRK